MKTIEKIRLRGDLSSNTFNYFLDKYPNFAEFYLQPKFHKRLQNIPGTMRLLH